jgi:hypothetical protein
VVCIFFCICIILLGFRHVEGEGEGEGARQRAGGAPGVSMAPVRRLWLCPGRFPVREARARWYYEPGFGGFWVWALADARRKSGETPAICFDFDFFVLRSASGSRACFYCHTCHHQLPCANRQPLAYYAHHTAAIMSHVSSAGCSSPSIF